MAVVYMAPDAVEAAARRITDVASELEERAAVIDGLLDEAGTWSGAPASARQVGELLAAVADDMVVRAEMIRTADEQGWPASVFDVVADAAPGEEMRRRLRDVGGAGLMALTVLDRLSSGTEALMHLGRSVTYGLRYAVARLHRAALGFRYTTANTFLDQRRLSRPTRRMMMRAENKRLDRARQAQARAANRAGRGLLAGRPLTSFGSRYPGVSRGVRAGGRALGAAGIPLSVIDGYGDFQRGDWGGVASNTAAAVGTGLMFTPAAPVGAVLVAGSLIYEYRGEIGQAASWARDKAGDLAEGVGNFFDL